MAAKRPRANQRSHDPAEVSAKRTRWVIYKGKRWQVRGRDRETGKKRLTRMTEEGVEVVLVDASEVEAVTAEEAP